eukprot:31207-Pelagococcus_subviridis.AAC.8
MPRPAAAAAAAASIVPPPVVVIAVVGPVPASSVPASSVPVPAPVVVPVAAAAAAAAAPAASIAPLGVRDLVLDDSRRALAIPRVVAEDAYGLEPLPPAARGGRLLLLLLLLAASVVVHVDVIHVVVPVVPLVPRRRLVRENERPRLLLHGAQVRPFVPRHVADVRLRTLHDGHVVAIAHVHVQLPLSLCHQPLEVLAALAPLARVPGDERHGPDVFHDAPGGGGELLSRAPASAKRVRKLIRRKRKRVVVEVVPGLAVARLIQRRPQALAV